MINYAPFKMKPLFYASPKCQYPFWYEKRSQKIRMNRKKLGREGESNWQMEFLNSLLMRLAVEREKNGSQLMEMLISFSLMLKSKRNTNYKIQP